MYEENRTCEDAVEFESNDGKLYRISFKADGVYYSAPATVYDPSIEDFILKNFEIISCTDEKGNVADCPDDVRYAAQNYAERLMS